MFEVEERLASFKGALLLGLREDFGGDPDHLEVALADSPNDQRSGSTAIPRALRRRCPAAPATWPAWPTPTGCRRSSSRPARSSPAVPCSTEGRPACHRCLLGVVDRREYDLVRRDLALEILDDLLGCLGARAGRDRRQHRHRQGRGVRAGAALQDRPAGLGRPAAQRRDHASRPCPAATATPPSSSGSNIEGFRTRYRIDEQEGLSTTPEHRARLPHPAHGREGPDIAVYLDGYQFHASPEVNNIAADAAKRRGVRAERQAGLEPDLGRRRGVPQGGDWRTLHGMPGPKTLLKGQAKSVAETAQHPEAGRFDVDDLNQNPMALLARLPVPTLSRRSGGASPSPP